MSRAWAPSTCRKRNRGRIMTNKFSLLSAAVVLAMGASLDAAALPSVDIGQREAVRNYYNALFYASENVDIGWTGGDILVCSAGTTSQAYKEATIRRVNVFRALAGVPASVTLDATFSDDAQQAALMMSRNFTGAPIEAETIHNPPKDWDCYTQTGHDAAGNSNVSLGSSGPKAILGFMGDRGANSTVPHRRWMLYPQFQAMGTGDVPATGSSANVPPYASNVLYFNDGHLFDARPQVREAEGYVAWPPPGYVPYSLVAPRWSISYPHADFRQARVWFNGVEITQVCDPTLAIPVTTNCKEKLYPADPASNSITGENTLVWVPSDPALADPIPAPSSDIKFTVRVQGVKVNGQNTNFDYTVTLFDPNAAADGEIVLPAITGSDAPRQGQNNAYTITVVKPIPAADGWEWLSGTSATYTAIQDAENGMLGDFLADIAGTYQPTVLYNPGNFTGGPADGGQYAFRLQDAKDKIQTLTLNKRLVPGPNGALNYESRLGYATTSEVASVQISLDDGHSWSDLSKPQYGINGKVESEFTPRTLSLATYRGKSIQGRPVRIRFSFDVKDRQSFQTYNPGDGIGWYFDNVGFTDTLVLNETGGPTASSDGSFLLKPAAAGTGYRLVARGTVQGYPMEWGPVKTVTAADGSGNMAPVANAGSPQAGKTINPSTDVALSGSGTDEGGDPKALTYAWTIRGPTGFSPISAATQNVTFKPTIPGRYTATLNVDDGALESEPSVVAFTVNAPPVARISATPPVHTGDTVTLDGSASSDPDDLPTSPPNYSWVVAGPTAFNLTGKTASFTPTLPGSYSATLKVDDGLASSSATATVAVAAYASPVANAGSPQSVLLGQTITLDGRGSADSDTAFGSLSFLWSQIGGPAQVVLAGANTAQPRFKPEVAGTYTFSLKVSDGGREDVKTVTVTVAEPPLRLLFPNGANGEAFKVKQKVTVRWTSTGLSPKLKLKLQFSPNGAQWKTLVTTKNTGVYQWKITKAQVSPAAMLRLCTSDLAKCDSTDAGFPIVK